MAAGAAALLGGLVVAVSWRDPLPGETGLLELVVVTDDGWRAVASAVAGATDLLPLAVVTGVLVAGPCCAAGRERPRRSPRPALPSGSSTRS
jgi:hypothetical protein